MSNQSKDAGANQSVLAAFYPFASNPTASTLVNETAKAKRDQALLQSVVAKANESIRVKEQFFEHHSNDLLQAARFIADTYRQQGKLLTAGNGGSSCDAAHLAVEFMHPVTTGRKALPAVNLSQDTAMITAVSNDVGVEHVLTRQLSALANSRDTLVVFSTSGNSGNLVEACRKAQALGMKVIAFTGRTGGEIGAKQFADICLKVPSDSIHRIQECHLACYHILWDLVHSLLADNLTAPLPSEEK
ncbi:SIS domain-containing protein [Aestuariibacter sp. GS-14]|uniref:D-sedoheptulose-7-phosphate isomerase n=1 Tax=Aestuariibacter sp. GS-14 TaxID=2590670 RepID=UPI00112BD5DD|nr:SIS domain-containing protein [Aestuariibacter sp. GS-14]TPV60683.1 SIS domain-containing protein [Aestuariibacter sp. GS-14]